MEGNFFAVGVGPGDPELLTLKAVRIIKESDVIVVPKSGGDKNIALEIAEDFVADKEVIEVLMPMIREENQLDNYHDRAALEIAEILKLGKNVSFLTLGDPCIYSTVMYVHKRLTAMGHKTAVVSGITSFCAAAAVANQSLCQRSEPLHIIPASYGDLEGALKLDGCKVLMKSGKAIAEVKEKLKNSNAIIVEKATMPDQKIYSQADNYEQASYFSVVLVPPQNGDNV